MKRIDVDNVMDYESHPKVISCGAIVYAIINNEIKYLLVKTHQRFGNSWDFPKGNREKNETEQDAAIREVYEETSLNITLIDGFKSEVHYLVNDGKIFKTSIYFLSKTEKSDVLIDPKEIDAYEWLNYDDAIERLTYQKMKQVLTQAKDFIRDINNY